MTKRQFDIEEAKRGYGHPTTIFGACVPAYFMLGGDLSYAPAYTVTNEDLSFTTSLTRNVPHNKVLTVAGSGEQALFYQLAGAQQIDTFDITAFANIMSNIKIAALRAKMPYDEYSTMLTHLHKTPFTSKAPGIDKIAQYMPAADMEIINSMDGYKIFCNGPAPERDPILTPEVYAQLQKMNIQSFPFIWSNVADIHQHIRKQYDIINLSNIFRWSPELIEPTLLNLRKHIRPGGFILVETGNPCALNKNRKKYAELQRRFRDWATMYIEPQNPKENVVMLQRTR